MCKPYQILDTQYEIDPGAVVFCPECKRQMHVEDGGEWGLYWDCFCGYGTGSVDIGHWRRMTVEEWPTYRTVPRAEWEQWIRDRTSL
jgi:hypothetical protein